MKDENRRQRAIEWLQGWSGCGNWGIGGIEGHCREALNFMIAKYIFVWFVLVFVAIINGTIRNEVYKNALGDLRAHQLSTLTGIILFGLVIWGFTRLWKITSAQQAWTIGFMWLGMTIAFELIFGHFVIGHPWSKLLHDYNIFQGRVWILMLIWTTIAPYVFYRLSSK